MDRPRALSLGVAATGLVCILHASPAAASPCDDPRPGIGVPIRVPTFGPADLGVAQEVCARTGVSLESRGAALVAAEDFYGSLLAGLAVRATVELPRRAWISAWFPGLEYRYVANATVDAGSTSLGAGALGLHVPIARGEAFELVAHARGLVPSETVFTHARRHGFEQGLSALVPVTQRLRLASTASFVSLITVVPGRALPAWSPSFGSDLVYRPSRGVALAAGVGLRPLESLDPRAQIRLYPHGGLSLSLGATFPLAGRDRTDVALALSIGWEGI